VSTVVQTAGASSSVVNGALINCALCNRREASNPKLREHEDVGEEEKRRGSACREKQWWAERNWACTWAFLLHRQALIAVC
jgi:hypothetical protein